MGGIERSYITDMKPHQPAISERRLQSAEAGARANESEAASERCAVGGRGSAARGLPCAFPIVASRGDRSAMAP